MSDNERRRHSVSSREELLDRSYRRQTQKKASSVKQETSKKTSEGRQRVSAEGKNTSESRQRRTSSEGRQRTSSESRQRKTSPDREQRSTRRRDPSSEQRRSTSSRGRTKKKKKKSFIRRYYRLIILIVIFLAVIMLIVNGIASLFSGSTGTMKQAFAKTISTYQKRPGITRTVLGKDVEKLIKNGDTSESFKLRILENSSGAQNITLSGDINKSTSSKTADMQLSLTYDDAASAQLKMYTDNKKIMFCAPGIYNSWLQMDCENIISQLKNSVLGENTEFSTDRDISLKLFPDEDSQNDIFADLSDPMTEIFSKEIGALSKKAVYEKIPKKEISIDGIQKKCVGYKMTVNDADMKEFVVNILDDISENKKIKTVMQQYAQLQFNNVELYSMLYDSPDELVKSYYKQIDAAKAQVKKASFKDTQAEIYLYKGVIADIDLVTNYNIDEDSVKAELKGGMHGGKNPAEDIDLSLTLSDGTQSISAAYTEETDKIGTTLINDRSFALGNGINDLTFNAKVTYDSSTGVINGSAALKTPSGGYIDISGFGTLGKEKGKTTVTAQEIKLDYNNSVKLVMDGSYEISKLTAKPKKPDGEVLDLFKADAAQIEQIRKTVGQNLDAVLSGMGELGLNEATETTEASTETTTSEE